MRLRHHWSVACLQEIIRDLPPASGARPRDYWPGVTVRMPLIPIFVSFLTYLLKPSSFFAFVATLSFSNPCRSLPFSCDWQGPHICKIAGRPVYFCDLRRAGDMPRGIVGLGQASAGSCGIRMGRQRAPAGSLSEGNQVRCPLIPVHFLFYFSFKTSSLFLLVAAISSSCFRRSLPFYLVFDCRGAYICAITGRPVYFCGLFGGPEAGG